MVDRLLLSAEDTAERLGISRSRAYRMIAAGDLPSIHLGERCVRVPASWLETWVERQTEAATERRPEPAHRAPGSV